MSVSPKHFETLYAESEDPWDLEARWSQRRKRAALMALLPQAHYRQAIEPGCGNGALTVMLADRVDWLHSFDVVADPVERTRARLADRNQVEVTQGRFPNYWPSVQGDLAVWSEVASYLDRSELWTAIERLGDWLEIGGDLIANHYTGATNNPLTGSEVQRILGSVTFLSPLTQVVDERFELGVWRRTST